MSGKIKLMVLILSSLFLLGFIYSVFSTFSEHREYGKFSMDYLILTPKEIGDIAQFCKDDPRFIYSSADGPKPSIISLNCEIIEEEKILSYLSHKQFIKDFDGIYKKTNEQIEIDRDQQNIIKTVTLIE